MTGLPEHVGPDGPRRPITAAVLAVLSSFLLALAAWEFYRYYPSRFGPAQPIAFSHRFHTTDKQLSCLFCHNQVTTTGRAGMPSEETCLLCHKHIIVDYPEIRKLQGYHDRGEAIAWVRVNDLPELAYFNHQVHIGAGIDCGHCHGDVKGMDRVQLVHKFQMGFCIQCHRDYEASTDCYTCHR